MDIKNSVKLALTWIGLFSLIIHFGFAFVYSKPIAVQKGKLDYYSQGYIYPYFHQNWNLFVPIPESNYKLVCEFENNGLQKVDVFAEIRIAHQTSRLKGYEPLLVAFTNSIYFFEKNTKQQEAINTSFVSDLSFKIIERAAQNYLEYTRKIKITKLKVILVISQSITNKQKVYFN